MIKILRPWLIKTLTGPGVRQIYRYYKEQIRQFKGEPHRVHVFLRINDPYSLILIQVLEQLKQRFDIEFSFHTIIELPDAMYPAPEMWKDNAFRDSQYLANLYQLQCPVDSPDMSPVLMQQLTAQLLHWELQPNYLTRAKALFLAYWMRDKIQLDAMLDSAVTKHYESYNQHRLLNEALLAKMGHYMSATLFYQGEWYENIGRLDHLERCLNSLSVNTNVPEVLFTRTYRDFCKLLPVVNNKKSKSLKKMELFFSIRSPYSYLGLERCVALARHYHVTLDIKPVLPMVMRKMQVQSKKAMYIVTDTRREADKLGYNWGYIADPLGAGVERCYALYEYAQQEGKAVDYLLSYARAVNTEGIQSETDEGLRFIVERCGLNWLHAKTLLKDDRWRHWAQDNLAQLYNTGKWGVPTVRYGELTVFGQDRLGQIEKAIVDDLQHPSYVA